MTKKARLWIIIVLLLVPAAVFFAARGIARKQNAKHVFTRFTCIDWQEREALFNLYHEGEITNKELRAALYNNDNRILKCPFCSHDVVPIQWGLVTIMPDSLDYDLNGRHRVHYGGCVVGYGTWACNHCDRHYNYGGRLFLDLRYEWKRLHDKYAL
jgi:hypothetical protein